MRFRLTSVCCAVGLVAQFCLTLCNPMDCSPPGTSILGDSPGKNTGVGCHALFQGIFPSQGLNPGFSHCKQILYQLSYQESPFHLQFSSVQLLSRVRLFATLGITERQASLSITNSWSSLRLMSVESVMQSNHLILCRPLLLLPPIPPSIRVFSNESTLCMRWPKYWSFSLSISASNEHPELISFRMDWLDLLAVQGISFQSKVIYSIKGKG